MRASYRILVSAILACGLFSQVARAASAPDAGTPFVPHPASQALYGVKPPDADPTHQRHVVKAADGADLFTETWLPIAKAGHAPPDRLPTILITTPYVDQDQREYPEGHSRVDVINYFVSRGYAVTQNHVRGTGQSGGCLEQTALHEEDDISRVIEYLGRDAPWTSGKVGMYGISYDAETQTAVAGLGDPERTKYLKAIVPVASVGGEYEYAFFDGVPSLGSAQATTVSYLIGSISTAQHLDASSLTHYAQKFPCQPQYALESQLTGDFTQYWREHELRQGARNIRAATLWVHGLNDFNVKDIADVGFFDHIPASTPHKGIFGVWEHAFPDQHTTEKGWERSDWMPATLAWYDRYLKDLKTHVESWPAVQVQASDGQWRAEPQWPTAGGPAGQLALGPAGALGVSTPAGATRYSELSAVDLNLGENATGGLLPTPPIATLGQPATFETQPVSAPLHVSGQPELDLWFTTDDPAARVGAKLEAFGADGKALPHTFDYGTRSARHLEPFVDNAFAQTQGHPAPTGTPIHMPVRFEPIDIVVPKGGRLRLTLAGSVETYEPSLTPGNITVLHDCAHPSALRFVMPHVHAQQLNVREYDEPDAKPLIRHSAPKLQVDGGGLARQAVCGAAPKRDAILGKTRPAVSAK